MNPILTKISAYDLFNNLFPGTLFVVIADKFFDISLVQENFLVGLFFYYFVGMIISRIGSLIIEPLLLKSKLIKFSEYEDYVEACKKDDKIELLSQVNNTYRTTISLFILLLVLELYLYFETLRTGLDDLRPYIMVSTAAILFIISYKKQTKYIAKRINQTKNERN